MNILLATKNKDKISEFKLLSEVYNINFTTLYDLKDNDEVIEDGLTFEDNALTKAKYFSNKYDLITIADDSGLSVEALNGKPGINSASYSKDKTITNNELLLRNMKDIPNRRAKFTTSLVIYLPINTYYEYKGVVEGFISLKPKGTNGFGYDPIFYIEEYGKTYGEMSKDLKNNISHRGIAFKKGLEKINEIINNEWYSR